ncbi:SirB2 family protein [Rhodoferax sp. GW822-FHT02A01]|uniref:SirB2 family protein n=1 Tax=Rhodoferax sp. GW822-FHT02A01 TaxID=3141537 RepID=UPI00315CEE87
MDYIVIKLLHQSAVILSGLGFAVRGMASLRGAQWTQGRLAKTLPHIVDTILLLSALTLAGMLRLNPAHTPWLLAKILGLLLYIGLGVVALRVKLAWKIRATAWVLALAVLFWIASVAILKNPWGFLVLVLPSYT